MKTFFFRRPYFFAISLLLCAAPLANAQAAPENSVPVGVAQNAGVEEAERDSDVTILPETDSADATILPDVKTQPTSQERRARLAERRRQSEERLLDLLREVGGDVPQLRASLRDFLTDEAQARKPMRAQGNRLLSALKIGVVNSKITTPEEAMQKLHEALRQEMPLAKTPDAAPEDNSAPGAGALDSELRVSLRQQRPAKTPDGNDERDSVRVLAQHDNAQLRALVATMRQMQADERAQRAAREAQLDAKLHFRDNPRLEAALLLLGIIGDSGYTVSIKMLPAPAPANTRPATASQNPAPLK